MNSLKIRLSLMMFLQFFIWGGWFVTLGTFLAQNLGADAAQTALAFSTQSWGAIIAPLFIGLVADRYFNAERLLALLHLVGAVLMYQMYQAGDFAVFYPLVLAYMLAYMPTLALVNSVAFAHLAKPEAEFGQIRVWGTIGWIVAGLVISFGFGWDSQQHIADGLLRQTFLLCAIASLLQGLYSFSLPKTQPAGRGQKLRLGELLGLDAIKLLKDRNFAVFFLSSVLICIPLAFYYQNANPFLTETGVANATGTMTLGQVSEVAFMLALPLFLSRFGIKWTLVLGMFAWVVRYLLFAIGDAQSGMALLLLGIALHGICYDFFFVCGQIYTNNQAGAAVKNAAQGLITLATYGVGMLIGFSVAGVITDYYALQSGHDWFAIWLLPALFAAAVMLLFAVCFKADKQAVA